MIIATHPKNLAWARDRYSGPYRFLSIAVIPERAKSWALPEASRFVSYDDRDRKWLEPLAVGTHDNGPLCYTLDSSLNPTSTSVRFPARLKAAISKAFHAPDDGDEE